VLYFISASRSRSKFTFEFEVYKRSSKIKRISYSLTYFRPKSSTTFKPARRGPPCFSPRAACTALLACLPWPSPDTSTRTRIPYPACCSPLLLTTPCRHPPCRTPAPTEAKPSARAEPWQVTTLALLSFPPLDRIKTKSNENFPQLIFFTESSSNITQKMS
jgi:hypothetical protein